MHIFIVSSIVLLALMASVMAKKAKFGYLSRSRCILYPKPNYDARFNLSPRHYFRSIPLYLAKPSRIIGGHPYVRVIEYFAGKKSKCGLRGVLHISLSNTTVDLSRGRVFIDFILWRPRGFVFHIGDSRGNQGKGGDDGSQSNNAEVVGKKDQFKIYLNDDHLNAKVRHPSFKYRSRVTLMIGDGEITYVTDDFSNFNYYRNPGLFALNDQFDAKGSENFNIYVGINRVIKPGTSRTGSGVCAVGVRFSPAIE